MPRVETQMDSLHIIHTEFPAFMQFSSFPFSISSSSMYNLISYWRSSVKFCYNITSYTYSESIGGEWDLISIGYVVKTVCDIILYI